MDVDLTRADVVGTYAGLRPLIAPSDGSTVKASREHRVTVGAERRRPDRRRQVHDLPGDGARRHRRGPRPRGRAAAPERHRRAPAGRRGRRGRPRPDRRPSSSTIPAVRAVGPEAAARLVARHGTEAPAVVALGAELGPAAAARRRAARSSRPRSPGPSATSWPLSLDDVLARRTRLAQELPDRGAAIAPRVAEIIGRELGWGAARQALEVETYLASARREFSVAAPEADGARSAAAIARDVTPAAVD